MVHRRNSRRVRLAVGNPDRIDIIGFIAILYFPGGDVAAFQRDVAFFAIAFFALTGQLLFRFFGNSVNSLRIVGGVIFFMMGMDMLQARLVGLKVARDEVKSYISDISITPLAIPMICGPGAITNAIVLMEDAVSIPMKMVLMGSIMLVLLLNYFTLYSSSRIIKLLGPTGNNVLLRLMGLIVMVIAVEFFFSGLKPIVLDMFPNR